MTAPDRLRVMLLTNSVQMGGMEEHVRLIAQELDRERFEVDVVFPEWPSTDWFVERLAAVADDVTQITPDRREGGEGPWRGGWRLFRHARRRRYDVAHLHSTGWDGLTWASLAVRAAGVRAMYVTDHLAPPGPLSWRFRLQRRLLQRTWTGLIAVSEKNRRARAEHLHTPDDRTTVVDNGIDVSRFDPRPGDDEAVAEVRRRAGVAEGELVVGTAIRFEPGKGVEDLVDAFALVRAEVDRARLVLVGDGSLRDELEARARRLGIDEHVAFVGFQDDPRPWIRAMDVFVIPVPVGSASIALLEAMAMSRPCVISFGGPGEAVVPGEHGFWAEPNDPTSIAEHVTWLLRHDDERRRMGDAARVRVERDFSATRVAEQLGELYERGARR